VSNSLGIRNVVALGVGRGSVVATTERRVHYWNAFDFRSTLTTETPSAPQLLVPKADSAEDANAGQCGIPLDVIEFLEDEGDCFGHVPLLKRTKVVSDVAGIQQVACGDQFAIGVAEGLELFTWGTAPLGRGKTTPTRLPFFPLGDVTGTITVGRVACGLRHVLLLTSHGGVFAWGSNVHGQLGVVPQGSALDAAVEEPTEVKLPSLALDIVCGDHHSVVLGDKGSLYAWGNNWHGQLAHDPDATETGCVFAPTKVNWWVSRDIQRGDERQETPSNLDEVASPSPGRRSQKPSSPSKNPPPRVYLLTAIGDTTAIVSEQGHVCVWGKCVPPGPVAGACGIVARWRPQHVDIPHELLDAERQAVATGSTSVSIATPITSPWASIAIANGLVLLTRHSLT
jgi:alpha-tubulin suppressor-like RCC1 family protein